MNNVDMIQESDEDIREGKFFKYVMSKCYSRKLINENVINKISVERMDCLKKQLIYYTKDESSSVMVEEAESIMYGIDYTIGVYLRQFRDINIIGDKLINEKLSYMLKEGYDIIVKKVEMNKQLLRKIMKNKLKVSNYSYNDTIDYGISIFFKSYDSFFKAHETPGDIDYQLFRGDNNYIGIEYIENYLNILNIENEFCKNFDSVEINQLLKGYDENSDLMLINIYELVLTNILGRTICGKSLDKLDINEFDREQIINKIGTLSLDELQDMLISYLNQLIIPEFDIPRKEEIDYMKDAIIRIADRIKYNLSINKLEQIFISFKDEDNHEYIDYNDGKKLSNKNFKKLWESVMECSNVEDKIHLIKANIVSLIDLVDMLNSEVFYDNEYLIYFKSLSSMEVAILLRYIDYYNIDNRYEKEWYYKFNEYINTLDEKNKMILNKMKEKIRFGKEG